MGGLLGQMARTSAERLDAARSREPLAALRSRALARPKPPALRLDRFDLIAEVKLTSPSLGTLATPDDPSAAAAARALDYARAGAAAISVLTEPLRFAGDLSHLAAAAAVCPVPVMRKDFLVDPYQVWEARAAGAGGVLLIARMLHDDALAAMLDAAAEAGLFVLLEAFDAPDLARCGPAVDRWIGALPLLVGVNCRDLVSLAIEPRRLLDLADALPPGVPAVAESGVEVPGDLIAPVRAGYRLALVGTSLMRAADPTAHARALVDAGREAACSS